MDTHLPAPLPSAPSAPCTARAPSRRLPVSALLGPGLTTLVEEHPSVGDVRGVGGLWTIELVRDPLTKEPLVPVGAVGEANAPMIAFARACLDRGLVPLIPGNRIHVASPLNLSDVDAATGLAIVDEALLRPTRSWVERLQASKCSGWLDSKIVNMRL